MIEIKFNLSKLNGSKWINWVKSMWMEYELGVNRGNIFVTQIQRKLCANK